MTSVCRLKTLSVCTFETSPCTGTTRTCSKACARIASRHGDDLNVRTQRFEWTRGVTHRDTHTDTRTHTTQPHTTTHTTSHGERRPRKIERKRQDRDRRDEEREHKTRHDKMKEKKTEIMMWTHQEKAKLATQNPPGINLQKAKLTTIPKIFS